jgi:predicted PurR-regulated permease PerM
VTTERTDDPRALIRYALLGIALTTALFWMLFQIRETLLLIYVAALIAIGLSPLVLAIQNHPRTPRRMPKWAAILVIYVLFVAFVVALAMLNFPPLITQARELGEQIPQLIERGQQWLIQKGVINQPISVRQAVEQAPGAGAKDAVGTLLSTLVSVVGGIFGVVAILILAFYLMLDAENILRVFVRFFPRGRRQRVRHACEQVTLKVSAWLGGQLLLAGIIGSTAAIGLWLIGVPYFYVLAMVAGIGEMIPMIGPVLSAIPAIIVGFSVSPQMGVGVAIFFLVQQQIENHLLVPKVMERQVGVSAVVVVISLLLGGSLLGIVGAILAVPTAAILQVVFQEFMAEAAEE